MYSNTDDSDAQWAPVSDLMAVLMLIFMFLAIIFVRAVVTEERVFQEECDKIYRVLKTEFESDFRNWKVDLLKDSTIRFRDPEVLFLPGSDKIRPQFLHILDEFFPRYMQSIQTFGEDIREIRIEGHTSSEYIGAKTKDDAYFLNMALSQGRTREILHYVLGLTMAQDQVKWARERITANGLSSSQLVYDTNGAEDKIQSRRVEFRLLASSCQKAGTYENED